MGKKETGKPFQSVQEYSVGSKVLIMQHTCYPGRLGSYGSVVEMQGNTPFRARCFDCGQTILVDNTAMRALGGTVKPKA